MKIQAILTDIEGTITDIHFVHHILFPYAAEKLPDFLQQHHQQTAIAELITEVKQITQQPNMNLNQVIQQLLVWIAEDKKITPLKTLQGHIWQQGYEQGALTSHLYPDAIDYLNRWHQQGLLLAIYSSGSVAAQKLLVRYSPMGDLTPIFNAYFDTHIGGKKEANSYLKIAQTLKIPANHILFLSDVEAELDAAQTAGMQTYCIVRDTHSDISQHPKAHTFAEIQGVSS